MNEKEGCFKFRKRSKDGSQWLEWTGGFPPLQDARDWYEGPNRGQFFEAKGYVFALFMNTKLIYPKWMKKS